MSDSNFDAWARQKLADMLRLIAHRIALGIDIGID